MEGCIKFKGGNYSVLVKRDTVEKKERTFNESTAFVVPEGVTSITVEVAGAGGGSSGYAFYNGSDCCDCGEK